MDPRKVLITYGWCRVGYAIMRNLAQHGIAVYAGGPCKKTMCSVSRYCSGSFVYPSPYTDPEGFIRAVIHAANKFKTGVYIPVHEETFIVAKYIEKFPAWINIPITTAENLIKCYDKAESMKILHRIGVSVPKTYYPQSTRDLEEILDIAVFPVIIKLRHSNSAKGVFKVDHPSDLLNAYKVMLKGANFIPIIQEFIEGNIYTVDVLYDRGKEVSYFCRKNIREKARAGGAATKCVSVYEPVLLEQTRKIFRHLKWHGVALCEFKYCPDSKRSYLFEINPRYWGTTAFDIDCGVEFPYYHYQIALGKEPNVNYKYPLDKVSLWILGDLIGFVDRMKDWHRLPSHLREYIVFDNDFYMDFCRDDPKAFFQQAMFYLRKFVATRSKNPVDEGMIG